MKRELDYLREFLLECESSEDFRFVCIETAYLGGAFREVLPVGWDQKKLFHYELLQDAQFVLELDKDFSPPDDIEFSSTVSVKKFRITSNGFDYLDSIRDDGIWRKTKVIVQEEGGGLALELIKSIATGFLKTKLEKHTGLEL